MYRGDPSIDVCMRRDALSASVDGNTIRIEWSGSKDQLETAFESPVRNQYSPADIDIAYRMQPSRHPAASGGVLSLTDAMTGTYLFEVNMSPSSIKELVQAADDGYVVEMRHDDETIATVLKETLLVYGADGTLIRERSLIPDHVEI